MDIYGRVSQSGSVLQGWSGITLVPGCKLRKWTWNSEAQMRLFSNKSKLLLENGMLLRDLNDMTLR